MNPWVVYEWKKRQPEILSASRNNMGGGKCIFKQKKQQKTNKPFRKFSANLFIYFVQKVVLLFIPQIGKIRHMRVCEAKVNDSKYVRTMAKSEERNALKDISTHLVFVALSLNTTNGQPFSASDGQCLLVGQQTSSNSILSIYLSTFFVIVY